MKALVIQKKKIGDVLTSTVIFEALKEKFPSIELDYLIYPNCEPVVRNNPFINNVILLDEKTKKNFIKFITFLISIKKKKYDFVIDVYAKPNSLLIGIFTGAKTKISFEKKYTKLFYTHTISRKIKLNTNATTAIEHRILLLGPLGIKFKEIKPKIFLTIEEKEIAKNKLISSGISISKPIIMISAIGSDENKTYNLPYMCKVIEQIATYKEVQLLFNYMPLQRDLAYSLLKICNPETQNKIYFNVYESDLREFLAITSHCKALIGNEGGATNMAKALNIPTFTIFAPFVKKIGWNMFENNTTNISVHVDDYVENDSGNNAEMYNQFKPEFFEDKLKKFIDLNCI
ncbi:MAG: glycosyltransferase family 9 protein [Flavobacterium sp.]|nr:glycosyltransferase family 9 protein [Flavobacterium sp.]